MCSDIEIDKFDFGGRLSESHTVICLYYKFRMPSSYGALVKEAIVLLDKFTAGKQCLDDFVGDISKDLQNMDPQHRQFVLDTVSGCIEHKELLDVVTNLFYANSAEYVPKVDLSMYHIVCYLTTFVLDELGLKCFSSIVKSLGVHKVQPFAEFFLTNLTTLIQEKWNGIYDSAHVQKQWIEPLLRWRPEIITALEQLADKVSCGRKGKKSPSKTTAPQEFALTKPKPRAIHLPEIIPEQDKHKPVPKTTYMAPKEMQTIEDIKQKNLQKTEELLNEANLRPFRCVNPQKSEQYQRVVSEIEEDMVSKLQFNSFQSSRLPSTTKHSSWDIKLNSAAILRQGALFDRQLKQELQRMERLVEGAQEPSSFLQWQKEMREKDLQEELAMVESRRLEGRISHEEAAMARNRLMAQNQRAAKLKKEETAELMCRYAEKRLQEEQEMRDLVQQVAEGHKNSKAAKERIHTIKQRIVKEVSEQSQELLRKALEEAQTELSRKFKIIREIHAIESISRIKCKNFDDTETAGHELLGEMSLAELKERLALLKEAQLVEQEDRRQHILEEKHNKKQMLLEQLDTIRMHRKALAHATTSRKEQGKAKLSLQQMLSSDETIQALQKKLEEKKQERKILKQSKSDKPTASQQAHSVPNRTTNKRSCEERDWEELKQSLEQGCQTHFHRGPHQHNGCPQRARCNL